LVFRASGKTGKVLEDLAISPDNDSGADAYFALHSIMDTAHKNKQPELQAILAIIS